MDTRPLCPGDSKMGRPLREARAKILDAECHGCLPLHVVNTMAKSNSWRKEFITLAHHNHSPSLGEVKIGNRGRNLEAETEADPGRKSSYCGFPSFCSICFLI